MSLNQFMHPRNKYKKPPDFKALAIKYPEFRKYAKQDISGKVKIDFKNLEALKTLTCTLLKEDFGLDVQIPLSRLIPTIPLRLNYLLWIEDILNTNQTSKDGVKGIDIGCGASCVYPLLAAKHFGWKMLATEVDTESAFMASSNVKRNKLQDMIQLRTVSSEQIMVGVLDADSKFDFCICNPPFFSSEEELEPQYAARNPARSLPRNAHSGAPAELVVPGGEVAFVHRIVQESVKLKGAVRVYSVMLGHKSSVVKVKQALQEAAVLQVAETVFCQGRTTRWGVAWTLDDTVVFPQTKEAPLTNKKKAPFAHLAETDLATTVSRLKEIMDELQITYSTVKSNSDIYAMEINAASNTWVNSRKKRRTDQQKLSNPENLNLDATKTDSANPENNDANQVGKEDEKLVKVEEEDSVILMKLEGHKGIEDEEPAQKEKQESSSILQNDESLKNLEITNSRKRLGADTEAPSAKKLKSENSVDGQSIEPSKENFLTASLIVKKAPQGSEVDLFWLKGTGGRNAAHQVFQYFKNNLKTRSV